MTQCVSKCYLGRELLGEFLVLLTERFDDQIALVAPVVLDMSSSLLTLLISTVRGSWPIANLLAESIKRFWRTQSMIDLQAN